MKLSRMNMYPLPIGGYVSVACNKSGIVLAGSNGIAYADNSFEFKTVSKFKADRVVCVQYTECFYATRRGDHFYLWSDNGIDWNTVKLPFNVSFDFSLNVTNEQVILSSDGRNYILNKGAFFEIFNYDTACWEYVGNATVGYLGLDPVDGVLRDNLNTPLNLRKWGVKNTDFVSIAHGYKDGHNHIRDAFALASEKHKCVYHIIQSNNNVIINKYPYIGVEIIDIAIDRIYPVIGLVQEPDNLYAQALMVFIMEE